MLKYNEPTIRRSAMTLRFYYNFMRIIILPIALVTGCSGKGDGKISLTTSSDEARKLYLQGRDLSERLRAKESLVDFQQAVEKDPGFASAYLALANNAQSAKDFFDNLESAAAHAEKASEGERLMITATQAGASGEIGRQHGIYERLVELFPQDERAWNLLGANYHFAQQKFEKAIECYQKAITINPKFSTPYNNMGYAWRSLEKYNEAADAFRKYIELIPDDPNPYDSYAELLLKTGQFDSSIVYYVKALSVRPDFANSYLGMACDYIYKGEHDKALAQMDKMYEIAKNDGERRTSFFGKALTFVDQGKFDDALRQLEKQFSLAQKNNDAGQMFGDLFTIGTLLIEQNKADLAQAKFDEAIKISDTSRLAEGVKENNRRIYLLNSILAAISRKDLKTAKTQSVDYAEAAKKADNNFQMMAAHQLRGMIALDDKMFDLAINELQQANLQDPYNFYRLGKAYDAKGNKEKAKELFAKAVNFNAFVSLNQCIVRSKEVKN